MHVCEDSIEITQDGINFNIDEFLETTGNTAVIIEESTGETVTIDEITKYVEEGIESINDIYRCSQSIKFEDGENMIENIFNKHYVFIILLILVLIITFTSNSKIKKWDKNSKKYRLLKYSSIISVLVSILLMSIVVINLLGVFTYDNKSPYTWYVDQVDYKKVKVLSKGDSQKIALIDSGISEFQRDKNVECIDLTAEGVYDTNGHGTKMFSLIRGYKEEVEALAINSSILSIKVLSGESSFSPDLLSKAIDIAVGKKATIICLCVGSYKTNSQVEASIQKALANDITVIASSGDYSSKDMLFPANMEGVISVGSISANGNISDFTNAGDRTDINLPGDEIKTIDTNRDVSITNGTSQATAIAAGYVACLKDYASINNKTLYNDKLILILHRLKAKELDYVDAFDEIK